MSQSGSNSKEIWAPEFRDVAKRPATSPEFGAFGTALESDPKHRADVELALIGPWDHDMSCAVASRGSP
jgi:hypothetical protein